MTGTNTNADPDQGAHASSSALGSAAIPAAASPPAPHEKPVNPRVLNETADNRVLPDPSRVSGLPPQFELCVAAIMRRF
jgi:hypothetical protein